MSLIASRAKGNYIGLTARIIKRLLWSDDDGTGSLLV